MDSDFRMKGKNVRREIQSTENKILKNNHNSLKGERGNGQLKRNIKKGQRGPREYAGKSIRSERCREQSVWMPRSGVGGRMNWEIGIDIYTLLVLSIK